MQILELKQQVKYTFDKAFNGLIESDCHVLQLTFSLNFELFNKISYFREFWRVSNWRNNHYLKFTGEPNNILFKQNHFQNFWLWRQVAGCSCRWSTSCSGFCFLNLDPMMMMVVQTCQLQPSSSYPQKLKFSRARAELCQSWSPKLPRDCYKQLFLAPLQSPGPESRLHNHTWPRQPEPGIPILPTADIEAWLSLIDSARSSSCQHLPWFWKIQMLDVLNWLPSWIISSLFLDCFCERLLKVHWSQQCCCFVCCVGKGGRGVQEGEEGAGAVFSPVSGFVSCSLLEAVFCVDHCSCQWSEPWCPCDQSRCWTRRRGNSLVWASGRIDHCQRMSSWARHVRLLLHCEDEMCWIVWWREWTAWLGWGADICADCWVCPRLELECQDRDQEGCAAQAENFVSRCSASVRRVAWALPAADDA